VKGFFENRARVCSCSAGVCALREGEGGSRLSFPGRHAEAGGFKSVRRRTPKFLRLNDLGVSLVFLVPEEEGKI